MKKNIVLISMAILTLLAFVAFATYAYFNVGTFNINNKSNVTATTEANNLIIDVHGGSMSLNVTASSMKQASANTIASQNSTTLVVNLTTNSSYSMVCTYDIVYEWTSNSSNRYTSHTSGVTGNEFTIQASLTSNEHVYEGTNNIKNETDLSTAVGNVTSAVVVSGAQIDSSTSTSTATWTLTSKFYNVNTDQSSLANKNYQGRFKITNVTCVAGTVTATSNGPTSYWFATGHYTFPNHGGTLETDPLSMDDAYIGQDDTMYYVCINVDVYSLNPFNISYTFEGDETHMCFSQPYTQYGLSGHTLNGNFTSGANSQQSNAISAMLQVINAAGININANNCSSGDTYVTCYMGYDSCSIYSNGDIKCLKGLWDPAKYCYLSRDGKVHCDYTE